MMADSLDAAGRGIPIAAIDLGTVSSRLSLAEVEGARVAAVRKHTVITDLGEGVDATGLLSPGAIERVAAACEGFMDEIRAFGAVAVCTTLTSAARDAANGGVLLERLRSIGLVPQVIPGEVEARLTFLGVARDLPGEHIAVVDSGGGSTEGIERAAREDLGLVMPGERVIDVVGLEDDAAAAAAGDAADASWYIRMLDALFFYQGAEGQSVASTGE